MLNTKIRLNIEILKQGPNEHLEANQRCCSCLLVTTKNHFTWKSNVSFCKMMHCHDFGRKLLYQF